MKKLLSIISLVALAMIANAQFTLTYENNAIENGSTIPITTNFKHNSVDAVTMDMNLHNGASSNKQWTLKTKTSSASTFYVSAVCGDVCEQGSTSSDVNVEADETKLVSVHVIVPENTVSGTTENITVMLYNRTTQANDITFTVAITYESSEGIHVVSIDNVSNAYPNPAVSNTAIEYAVEGSAQFVVTDIAGRQVMEETISGNGTLNLNVENFHRGVYLYGIRQGNKQSAMKKLVVR